MYNKCKKILQREKMGKQYRSLTDEDIAFIEKQHLCYIASCSDSEVNLSPRGFDSIRVVDANTVVLLDYPGSGNRTARDIKRGGKITLLFNAFSGPARILRLFCKGELIEKYDFEFPKYFELFDERREYIRRIIRLNVEAVESSCGMGVPKMEYQKDRSGLKKWIKAQHEDGALKSYIESHEEPPSLDFDGD